LIYTASFILRNRGGFGWAWGLVSWVSPVGLVYDGRFPMDIDYLRQWIGRTETRWDVITAGPMVALSATLDREDPSPVAGDPVPPLWHWLYFLDAHRQSELGPEGHAKTGGFLPPVPLPRRMWAGGRFEFKRPLRVGEAATRVSTIVDVQGKRGRTGALVFVTMRHEVGALTEEQDIVYRDHSKVESEPLPAPNDALWTRSIEPDDVLLFRYSALTFNAHRIHYDRRYATEVEGYPGLVVHGPLIATLLLDLVRRNLPEATVTRFEFRAVRALFDGAPFSVCGRPDQDRIRLWARDETGALAMLATAAVTPEQAA
jgi:3-methylfumaryl-CoA hydratase